MFSDVFRDIIFKVGHMLCSNHQAVWNHSAQRARLSSPPRQQRSTACVWSWQVLCMPWHRQAMGWVDFRKEVPSSWRNGRNGRNENDFRYVCLNIKSTDASIICSNMLELSWMMCFSQYDHEHFLAASSGLQRPRSSSSRSDPCTQWGSTRGARDDMDIWRFP